MEITSTVSGARDSLTNAGVDSSRLATEHVPLNRQLGRYRLLRQLGRGGMGIVYLAKDPLLNREVAIKTVDFATGEVDHPELLRNSLLRDARAAAGLSHPNIVSVYDVIEAEGRAYLVLEYVDGETLTARLRTRNVLDAAEALQVVREMASALDYTHSRGIIHRDIKPSNVMISADGTVKIMDFGIARIDGGRTNTPTGLVVGTIEYMSPEQVMAVSLDGRTDQFSLAAVAYQMLTGSTLFGQHTVATLAYKIVHETPPAARTRNGSLPVDVDVVLSKALSKSPGERFSTCSQFASALELALSAPPTVTVPAIDSGNAARLPLRGSPIIVITTVVLVLLAAALFCRLKLPASKPPSTTHSGIATSNTIHTAKTKRAEAVSPNSPLQVSRTQSRDTVKISRSQPTSTSVRTGPEKRIEASAPSRPISPKRTVPLEQTAKQADAKVISQNAPTPVTSSPPQLSQAPPNPAAALPAPQLPSINLPLNPGETATPPKLLPAPQASGGGNAIGRLDAEQDESEVPDGVLQAYRQGLGLMKAGNNSAAIEAFTEAITRSRPKLSLFRHRAGYEPAYVARGLAHQHQRQSVEAIQDYTQAIQLKPRDVVPYVERGICFAVLHQNDRALADFNAALSIHAGIPLALEDRGVIFGREKQYQLAIQDFTEAIRLDPKLGTAYANRGIAERAIGDEENARTDFTKARELASAR